MRLSLDLYCHNIEHPHYTGILIRKFILKLTLS